MRATIRWPARRVQASQNIWDFWPVVPDEVACTATSSRGTDSTSCILKKFACTNGWRARSEMDSSGASPSERLL